MPIREMNSEMITSLSSMRSQAGCCYGGAAGVENPKRGLISPDPFIPQLDEMGMMQEVDAWRFTPPAGISANGRVG